MNAVKKSITWGLVLGLLAISGIGPAWAGRGYGHGYGHGYGGSVRFGVVVGPYWGPWYYPSPYYYPPYPPVVIERSPPVYIEQSVPPPAVAPQANQNNYWYFCSASNAYYPYAKECPGGWQRVLPQPPDQP